MSAAPNISASQAFASVLSHMDAVPVLPHVVFQVLEVSNSTDAGIGEMERVINVDPGFTSKILASANSAFYGLPRQVSSIKDALMFLGVKAVRNLAMTIGVFDLFLGKNDAESLRRRDWWRHSLDTAICAKTIASQARGVSPDDAYTCGLLHWIGKTLLDRFGGRDYAAVQILQNQGMSDVVAEWKVYGTDHVAIAQAAGQKWGLPISLLDGMRYNDREMPNDHPENQACTALATYLASCIEQKVEAGSEHLNAPMWALARFDWTSAKLDFLMESCAEAVSQAKSAG